MTDKFHFKIKKPENRDLFILSIFLQQYLNRLRLQKKRIECNMQPAELSRLDELFADIHFYFNTVSNIQKILLKIKQINSADEEFMLIYKKYLKPIQKIDIVRDHLEHITDNRFKGKDRKGGSLKEPNMLGSLFGDVYNFCGDAVNLKDTFKMISELETDISNWDKENPLRNI